PTVHLAARRDAPPASPRVAPGVVLADAGPSDVTDVVEHQLAELEYDELVGAARVRPRAREHLAAQVAGAVAHPATTGLGDRGTGLLPRAPPRHGRVPRRRGRRRARGRRARARAGPARPGRRRAAPPRRPQPVVRPVLGAAGVPTGAHHLGAPGRGSVTRST